MSKPLDIWELPAFFGIIFGPIAFLESCRIAPPVRVPLYVDLVRLLFLGSWAASAYCAAVVAIYT